jgi:hypothetical protein
MVSHFNRQLKPKHANSTTDGHYLNLPVMNEGGEIVGMVDVLKLTYATLEQVCR